MKLLSINVCGLKSKLNIPEFNELIHQYDLIGLQETKLDDIDSVNISGYKIFCNNRQKISRYRSGGTALLVKENIAPYVKIGKAKSKLIQWFSISNKITRTHNDIQCGLIYLPPNKSKYASEDPYLEIQAELNSMSSNHIILFGDLNSRTANLKDYVLIDEFMSHMHDNDVLTCENAEMLHQFECNNVPLDRNTADTTTNAYGYHLLEFCRSNNMFIVNGRFGLDCKSPKLTCKDASTVDYFITTAQVFAHICDFEVLDFSPLYSDSHTALVLTLDIWPESSYSACTDTLSYNDTTNNVKLWNKEKSESFVENLDQIFYLKYKFQTRPFYTCVKCHCVGY